MKSTTRWEADSGKRSISNASNANLIIAAYHSTPKKSCEYATKAFPSRKHTYWTFSAGKIIVEIKAVSELTKEHRAQLLNYLRLTKCKMGLLVNFASYPKATVEQWAL